jgi:hypothetical protein
MAGKTFSRSEDSPKVQLFSASSPPHFPNAFTTVPRLLLHLRSRYTPQVHVTVSEAIPMHVFFNPIPSPASTSPH